MARTVLALTLAGIVAVLSGGMLFLTAGGATSVPATADTPCVPSDAWTETTDWVLASPGEGWRQVDQRTVVDQEAYDEVVQEAYVQHYSWTGGRRATDDPPTVVPPHEYWQPNTRSEPHDNGGGNPATWLNESLHYTANSCGSASWFYLEHVPAVVVHHDAVTHEEFRFAFDHPAVVCPTEPPTTQPPTTQPPTTPPTTQPPTAQPPEVLPTTATPSPEPSEEPSEEATPQPDDVEVLGAEASLPTNPSPPRQVPTVVDAGLSAGATEGTAAAQQWGVVLAATGLVLLAAAGGVLVKPRRS